MAPSFTVLKDTIPGIRFADSVSINLHIDPTTDKGLNKITVTIDADNDVDESWENNNTITKDVFIFEDDARPVYPLNYAIINKQNIKLYASTANPFSPSKQYRMEIDTTNFFNSSFKRTVNITSVGGLLEFNPGITFTDSTVYYWRVSPLDGAVILQNGMRHPLFICQIVMLDLINRIFINIPNHSLKEYL